MENLRVTASAFSWDSTGCDTSTLLSFSLINGQTFLEVFLSSSRKHLQKHWGETLPLHWPLIPPLPIPQSSAHTQSATFSLWRALCPGRNLRKWVWRKEVSDEQADRRCFVLSRPSWPGRQLVPLARNDVTKRETQGIPDFAPPHSVPYHVFFKDFNPQRHSLHTKGQQAPKHWRQWGWEKAAKANKTGQATLGSACLTLLSAGEVRELLESRRQGPELQANSHFLCNSVCTPFTWALTSASTLPSMSSSLYLRGNCFASHGNWECGISLRCGHKCGIWFKSMHMASWETSAAQWVFALYMHLPVGVRTWLHMHSAIQLFFHGSLMNF